LKEINIFIQQGCKSDIYMVTKDFFWTFYSSNTTK